jgi:esterase/lipase superfamily enzyme
MESSIHFFGEEITESRCELPERALILLTSFAIMGGDHLPTSAMKREYHHWMSRSLGKEMELLLFGYGGVPVVVFPTSDGRFFEYEDRGMVAALAEPLEKEEICLVCADSVDSESWFNESIPPRSRIERHLAFERYLVDELVPFVRQKMDTDRLCVTGCSFGGFHAVNFALKHPECVQTCISLSGTFDVHQHLDGYSDDDSYFNDPLAYLPGLKEEQFLRAYRNHLRFILAAGEWDFALDGNLRLSRLLEAKGVKHILDIWGDHTRHDWPWWQLMIRKFLGS